MVVVMVVVMIMMMSGADGVCGNGGGDNEW